jgi:hypothetical protein
MSWGIALELEVVTGSKHIAFVSLDNMQHGLKYFFIVLFTSYYANLLIKASVCVMLLRIMQERAWRIGLWVMLAFLFAIAVAVTATNLLACSPPSAYWTLATHSQKCWSTEQITVVAQVLGGTFYSKENA